LRPGQRVLDVGCGTGLSLELLRAAVGPDGMVYGCDQSPEMLAIARRRQADAGWRNVQLLQSAAQLVELPEAVDALLFHYTHDVLRSPAALARLLACARPQARVAIAGVKYFPGWLAPLNLWVYFKNYGYNGAPGELATPWDRILPFLDGWQMEATQFGMGYIGSGRVAAARTHEHPDGARRACTTRRARRCSPPSSGSSVSEKAPTASAASRAGAHAVAPCCCSTAC
jgi:arsenite methyltransferase